MAPPPAPPHRLACGTLPLTPPPTAVTAVVAPGKVPRALCPQWRRRLEALYVSE